MQFVLFCLLTLLMLRPSFEIKLVWSFPALLKSFVFVFSMLFCPPGSVWLDLEIFRKFQNMYTDVLFWKFLWVLLCSCSVCSANIVWSWIEWSSTQSADWHSDKLLYCFSPVPCQGGLGVVWKQWLKGRLVSFNLNSVFQIDERFSGQGDLWCRTEWCYVFLEQWPSCPVRNQLMKRWAD